MSSGPHLTIVVFGAVLPDAVEIAVDTVTEVVASLDIPVVPDVVAVTETDEL